MLLKICGIRRPEDVDILLRHPPDYAGFVFANSRRRVTPEAAKGFIGRLPPSILKAGVFVNETPEKVADITLRTGLGAVQLHGDEPGKYITGLRALLPPSVQIWKAVRVKDGNSLIAADMLPVDMLLLDAYNPSAYGGTGKAANWSLIRKCRPDKPFLLAGGITCDNCREAIAQVRPHGLDVSSGAETGGYKDMDKIARLIGILKG